MGRIFLLAIVAGFVWGGYKIYENITGLTDGESLASRYQAEASEPASADAENTEGHHSGPIIKDVPARSSSEEIPKKAAPLPVLAFTKDFLQVEAWGIVRAGDELPDGSVIRSWSDDEALVTSETGELERRRFRRFSEAMALVVPAMATSVEAGSWAVTWPPGSQSQSPEKP